ncbi:hypothetical protein BH11MYX4_BH11MYX4_22240 [soil metagenome]
MLLKHLTLVMLLSVIALVGCGPPDGYSVRIVDASGRALRSTMRNGTLVVAGKVGETYGIEITNQTNAPVGVVVSVDGLDARRSGRADMTVDGLKHRATSVMDAYTHFTMHGFDVAPSKVSTFRFTDQDHALATALGTPATLGEIEIDFLALTPGPPNVVTPGPVVETNEAESDASYVRSPPAPSVSGSAFGEIIADPRGPTSTYGIDQKAPAALARITIRYEAPEGVKIGTAGPPPSSQPIARDVALATDPALEAEPTEHPHSGVRPTKPVLGGRPTKPSKTTKAIETTKPSK